MASSTGQAAPSPASPVVASAAPPPATTMEPKMDAGLLALACSGSFEDLESLLNGKPAAYTLGSSARQPPPLYAVTVGGDTLLHVVAAIYGDSEDSTSKASLVYDKAPSLLFVQNSQGDTPLHCAARAGNFRMVSLLVDLVKGQGINNAKGLLETQNKLNETALHEAVRIENNDMVNMLMTQDRELATLPDEGTSPLYLAILLENKIITKTLYELSGGVISYSGPSGQNALHAAVLRGKDLTKMLLEWNNALMIQQDENGSTPLHLSASVLRQRNRRDQQDQRATRLLLLKASLDVLYQTDNDGSFPIHVAASVGATLAISDFLRESPSCAGLRDARGRTFLHVAVEKGKMWTVSSACRNRSLLWILNMQDNKGNTAMHLAVQTGRIMMFYALFGNREVHLNSTNEKRETPLDIANRNISKGLLYYLLNSEVKICHALEYAGAKRGVCRQDYFEEDNIIQGKQDGTSKMDQVKEGTRNLCVGSVLIATITFGASFAMPGGYRADEHNNGGTPTLARRYAFGAFVQANALAFASSMMATIALMSSGSPMHNPQSRAMHITMAFSFMDVSITSLVAAFALGTYTMLAPVAHRTAVVVCVLSYLALLYRDLEIAINNSVLAAPLCRRKGILCHGIVFSLPLAAFTFVGTVIFQLWPLVVIYCLTALSHIGGKVELAAQPPTPLA